MKKRTASSIHLRRIASILTMLSVSVGTSFAECVDIPLTNTFAGAWSYQGPVEVLGHTLDGTLTVCGDGLLTVNAVIRLDERAERQQTPGIPVDSTIEVRFSAKKMAPNYINERFYTYRYPSFSGTRRIGKDEYPMRPVNWVIDVPRDFSYAQFAFTGDQHPILDYWISYQVDTNR